MSKNNKITKESPSIATQSTSKKISFFAAMLIVMGSSIGAGIFLKAGGVLDSVQGSLVLAIITWLIAAFAVISMALALVEIASARNDNLSLIGWCKVFNNRSIYKASKNFMFYVYLPLTYFFMPFYMLLQIQDGVSGFLATTTDGLGSPALNVGNGKADWVIWLIIALAISIFFIILSGYSSRAGNIMNMGITAIKFLPLAFCGIIGFVFVGIFGAQTSEFGAGIHAGINTSTALVNDAQTGFGGMSPGIGIFLAIGAIFFAYDGFYVTAGLQSEMKEPKRTPIAILFGLGATTVIYLIVAISMSMNGSGSFYGFGDWLASENLGWLFGLVNVAIAIGILGIINGFAMWSPRFVEDLISENEVPFSERFKSRLNANKPKIGIIYCLVLSIPIVILFTLIGALAYPSVGAYQGFYGNDEITPGLGGTPGLYNFCDIMGTWTAVLAFTFIMLPIAGGLKNRKIHFVKTDEKKWFTWSAYATVIIVSLALIFLFIEPFVNLALLSQSAFPGVTFTTAEIVGRVMKVFVLLLFVGIMIVPTFIEDKIHIKQYGSIAEYEKVLGLEPTMKKVTIQAIA